MLFAFILFFFTALASGAVTRSPTTTPQPSISPAPTPADPTIKPIALPTVKPSFLPTIIPSRSPTTISPTAEPTTPVPTQEPTEIPTRAPTSSKPTIAPTTLRPTRSPTFLPTRRPTFVPTMLPTSLPSSRPTSRPTSVPTPQPTNPTSIPTSSPTNPTSMPSSSPSSEPSRAPSSQPTGVPTRSPSSRPSSQPSSHPTNPSSIPTQTPSGQPTSIPTTVPECYPGYYYIFVSDGYECKACPPGQYAEGLNAHYCTPCPKGTYAPGNASSVCTTCPSNQYNSHEGQSICTFCPGSEISAAGSTSESQCVNPLSNFVFAFICLLLCLVALSFYICGGRLRRIAFLRRERLLKPSFEMYNLLHDNLHALTLMCGEIVILNAANNKAKAWQGCRSFIKTFIAPVAIVLFIILATFYYFIGTIVHVFFTALIIWRGYHFNFSFAERIEEYINEISIQIHVPFLRDLAYPFIYIANVIADININLSYVKVTCLGAQAPIRLLVDCIVMGIVVIIIESDVEIFWNTSFRMAHGKYQRLFLNRFFLGKNICSLFVMISSILSVALSILPHPRKILQYALGLVAINLFFDDNGVSSTTPACDNTLGGFPMDSILGITSSIIAYLLIPPIVYTLSQVLVPNFDMSRVKSFTKCQGGRNRHSSNTTNVLSHLNNNNNNANVPPVHAYPAPAGGEEERISVHFKKDDEHLKSDGSIKKVPQTGCKKSCNTFWARLYKFFSFLSSIDWFYLKIIFAFADALYRIISRFIKNHVTNNSSHYSQNSAIVSTNLQQIETHDQTVEKPKLPWFHSFYYTFNEHASAMKEKEIEEWKNIRKKFPSYYQMVQTVREDMINEWGWKWSVRIEFAKYNPVVQYLTPRGSRIWNRVGRNYVTFALCSFGFWTDEIVEDFGLMDKIKVTYNASQKGRFVKDDLEEETIKNQVMNLFTSIVSTRLILIQMVSVLTIYSLIVVDISEAPVLVFSSIIGDKIPRLLVGSQESNERAQRFIQRSNISWLTDGNDTMLKKIITKLIALNFVVNDSRLIRFVLNMYKNTFAITIIFVRSNIGPRVALFVTIFLIYGLINAMYPFVLLCKLIYPVIQDKHHGVINNLSEQTRNIDRNIVRNIRGDGDNNNHNEEEGMELADIESAKSPSAPPLSSLDQQHVIVEPVAILNSDNDNNIISNTSNSNNSIITSNNNPILAASAGSNNVVVDTRGNDSHFPRSD